MEKIMEKFLNIGSICYNSENAAIPFACSPEYATPTLSFSRTSPDTIIPPTILLNFGDGKMKWCIKTAEGKVKIVAYYICSHFLAFETEEKAKLFLKEKIDLITDLLM
jgi:hypothetical protein